MSIKFKDRYGPLARLRKRKSQLKKLPEGTQPEDGIALEQRMRHRKRMLRVASRAFFQKNIG